MSTDNNQNPNRELEVLWTVNQTAQYLSLSPVTVYKWISTGKVFDKSKLVRFSNRVRIPRSEVLRVAGVVKSKLENQS